MPAQDSDRQKAEALAREAASERTKAGERFVEAAQEGDEHRKGELLGQAREALGKAEALDREGEAEAADKPTYTERRDWRLPGSVSGDILQSFQEAEKDGSLLGQLVNYAARSATERDGKAWQWTKEGANAVLSHFGKDAGQHQEADRGKDKAMEPER